MNPSDPSVSEADLHAYADGQLEDSDRERVEAWLSANSEDAARVRTWQRQNAAFQAMFGGYGESRPDDARLISRAAPRRASSLVRYAMAAAAASLIFVSGVATGRWTPGPQGGEPQSLAALLPSQANSAYLIYASDVRRPVEVGADQRENLVKWLGNRLGYPLTAPDLGKNGFQLIGGRLVPVSGKPGALFMYEDKTGRRVTVMVGRNETNRSTSFRIASVGDLETFYWIDGPVGYAVTGEISRSELQTVADETYRQFAN